MDWVWRFFFSELKSISTEVVFTYPTVGKKKIKWMFFLPWFCLCCQIIQSLIAALWNNVDKNDNLLRQWYTIQFTLFVIKRRCNRTCVQWKQHAQAKAMKTTQEMLWTHLFHLGFVPTISPLGCPGHEWCPDCLPASEPDLSCFLCSLWVLFLVEWLPGVQPTNKHRITQRHN